MITSMTGFGGKAAEIAGLGKVTVELRSTNHKFLDIVLHLPEGFLSLEEKVKKEIEGKVKRGRITCAINISRQHSKEVSINHKLLKSYVANLKKIKQDFNLKQDIDLQTLVHMPGVLSLAEENLSKEKIWPDLRLLVSGAVGNLVKMRQKEGAALQKYLHKQARILDKDLTSIKARFKAVMQAKSSKIASDEEKSSFLKNSDIHEEMDRLAYHIKNFIHKLSVSGPIGKEMDFIAQEMQREANTTGAKSCDSLLSAKVVQIKSHIEKIREQVQNIE